MTGSQRCLRTVLMAFVFSTSMFLAPYQASALRADNPFTALIGSWSGTGTILLASGAKERLRCAANNRFVGGADHLHLELSCESDSYRFQLRSQVTYREGAVSGTWDELTRAAGGSVDGRVSGNQIRIRAEGQTFTAVLSLTTQADRQTVAIQSPGSEMSNVNIVLTRKAR